MTSAAARFAAMYAALWAAHDLGDRLPTSRVEHVVLTRWAVDPAVLAGREIRGCVTAPGRGWWARTAAGAER